MFLKVAALLFAAPRMLSQTSPDENGECIILAESGNRFSPCIKETGPNRHVYMRDLRIRDHAAETKIVGELSNGQTFTVLPKKRNIVDDDDLESLVRIANSRQFSRVTFWWQKSGEITYTAGTVGCSA
jgi:hypothetical protein